MNNKSFLKRFNSINQQDDLRKTTKTLSNNIISLNRNQQTKKLIQRLEKQLKQQKDKKQQIETKFENFKERFVNRQRQFYKILEKFNTQRQIQTKDDIYITEIYQKIICTFDAFNQKARELLDDRYSELYRLMERRVDILMQKMDKQLSKYRKIAHQERKQIQQAIRDIGIIAAETQNQNVTFRKKNQLLQLKLQLINQQKQLLLQEITGLKAHLSKLKKTSKINSKAEQFQQKKQDSEGDFWKNIQSLPIEHISNQTNRRALTGREYRYSNNDKKAKATSISMQKTIDYSKTQKHISSYQDSTITHLKQNLARQKNKNLQLIKYTLQLQTKQQKIKEIVFQQINKETTKGSQHSLIQSDASMNESELLIDSIQRSEGKDQFSVHVDMRNKSSVKSQQEQNLIGKNMEEQKRVSKLINELNKILYLPQTDLNDAKSIIKQDYQVSLLTHNQQKQPYSNKINHTLSIHLKQPVFSIVNNNNSQSNRRKLSSGKKQFQRQPSQMSNRSKVHGSNENKKKSYLFANSPLDIMDITRSIQVK